MLGKKTRSVISTLSKRLFRDQIDVVSDELRQLAGNAEVPEEALKRPIPAVRQSHTPAKTPTSQVTTRITGDPAQRISLQRLECGYTEAAPFRTLSRACLEAAIITSRDYQRRSIQTKCTGEHRRNDGQPHHLQRQR